VEGEEKGEEGGRRRGRGCRIAVGTLPGSR
jgi:hypothetical protein